MNSKIPVILIFDVGRTNKKCLLFDRSLQVVQEQSVYIPDISDDDGFPAEDLQAISEWLKEMLAFYLQHDAFDVVAINNSAHGAALVHLNSADEPVGYLYNYLKPFSESLHQLFDQKHGDEKICARETASPILGNLNSGMQLWMIKNEKPDLFSNIHSSLHLPQYVSWILGGKKFTDLTSVGCHTMLWDFTINNYHAWVRKEHLENLFPPLSPPDDASLLNINGRQIPVGPGLHDSSAALLPYLELIEEPFLLISTGSWNINLNPFNDEPLTDHELAADCLCFLTPSGKQVKASRLIAGLLHDEEVKKIGVRFNCSPDFFKEISYDPGFNPEQGNPIDNQTLSQAYHKLIFELVEKQITATNLALGKSSVRKIFVDGGFSKNVIFMSYLLQAFPDYELYSTSLAQASSLGAALVFRNHLNANQIDSGLLNITRFV
jgi:sugar (pentulose or hexulose) kinase